MKSSVFAACLALVVIPFGSGCVKSPTAQFNDDMKTMRVERNPERLLRQAEVFQQLGDLPRAAQYYELAIENGADEKKVLPHLLEALMRDRQYRSATTRAREYLRRHPGDVSLRFFTATLHIALGEGKRARQELERVLDTEPQNSEAHYVLAVLLRDESKDPVQADAHFRRYLQLNPRGAHAEEARDCLLKAVQ